MRQQNDRRLVEDIVKELENIGFYLHAEPDFDERARIELARTGDILPEECGRAFTLDAELLYESGANKFLSTISSFLEKIGALTKGRICKPVGKFEILLGGRVFMIAPEADDPLPGRWTRAGLRLLVALDWFLERQGVQERCYYTHLDNDSEIGFLTPRMAELVVELGNTVGRPVVLHRAVIPEDAEHYF